jgi:hypothetical protein
MSKSIGKIFGTGSVNTYDYENNYLNYLKNYDTSAYDGTVNNMTAQALNMSDNLSSLPDYNFSVSASDEARQRAENATYQSYVDKLTPQFTQQTNDLETSLANKGISVGSEAYERAMSDLQNNQNDALNQAAYQSVLNGQNAYSQSLNDSISAADFSNSAQQNYINQILSLISNSVSGYDNEANIYNTENNVENRKTTATQSGWNNLFGTLNSIGKYVSSQK